MGSQGGWKSDQMKCCSKPSCKRMYRPSEKRAGSGPRGWCTECCHQFQREMARKGREFRQGKK